MRCRTGNAAVDLTRLSGLLYLAGALGAAEFTLKEG
jgi:hypothetical protein